MKDSLPDNAAPATVSVDEPATSDRSFVGVLKRALRVLAVLAMIAVAFTILTISLTSTGTTAHKDFIACWAAGRLLIHHANPFDADAVFALEKSAGYCDTQALIMRNPPYSLWLSVLAGLLSPVKAAAFWILLIVASIVASIRMLWAIHGRPPDRIHLLGYLFAPTFACTVFGQISSFVLLGVVGFLYWNRSRPFLAGLCITLLALKPQILLPFGLVLLVWIVLRQAVLGSPGGDLWNGADNGGAAVVPAFDFVGLPSNVPKRSCRQRDHPDREHAGAHGDRPSRLMGAVRSRNAGRHMGGGLLCAAGDAVGLESARVAVAVGLGVRGSLQLVSR